MSEHSAPNPINFLSEGFLNQFSCLKDLEEALTQLLAKQSQLENELKNLNNMQKDQIQAEIAEVSLTMRKMKLYLNKVRGLRSDMLYICQRVTELKKRAIEIQAFKVEEKAAKEQKLHNEAALINKAIP